MKILLNLALTSLTFTFTAKSVFADDPVHGCRVKKETLAEHGTKVNNAGCILTKVEGGEVKFLMVYVDKIKDGKKDSGWGFPGGTSATTTADKTSPTTQKIAEAVDFEYVEPAVCTAARETREETGIEVIVGDLVKATENKSGKVNFLAFQCFSQDKEALNKEIKPADVKEIKNFAWVSVQEIKDGKKPLRFQNNMDIIEAALTKLVQKK